MDMAVALAAQIIPRNGLIPLSQVYYSICCKNSGDNFYLNQRKNNLVFNFLGHMAAMAQVDRENMSVLNYFKFPQCLNNEFLGWMNLLFLNPHGLFCVSFE